jgi:hypothetical protein
MFFFWLPGLSPCLSPRSSARLRSTFGAALALLAAAPQAQQPEPVRQAPAARLMVQSGQVASGNVTSPSANTLALAPGGQVLATVDGDSARVWHTASGRLLCELQLDALQRARLDAALALALAQEARLPRESQRQPQQVARDLDKNVAVLGSPIGFAWSADARTLYAAAPGLPLQRWDIAGCRSLPPLALPAALVDESNFSAQPFSRLSSLADGRLLLHSATALHRLRVTGDAVQAELLADRARLSAASAPPPTAAKPATGGGGVLSALRDQAREALSQQMTDVLPRQLLGTSADGGTVLLGASALAALPGVARIIASVAPLLVHQGQVLPLSSLAGARPTYPGATMGAVSASGRWVALGSESEQGQRLSLFDLSQRRLVHESVLQRPADAGAGAAEADVGARLFELMSARQALGGLAFSPDERLLVLYRDQGDTPPAPAAANTGAKAGTADTGPVLELRRVDAGAAVQRRVLLLGSVLPAADIWSMFVRDAANKLAGSANGQAFAFRVVRQLGRATTLATATWQDGLPLLRSWTPGEGSVDQLVFADDEHLISLQSAPLAPTEPLQSFLPLGFKGTAPETIGQSRLDQLIGAVNAMQANQQVVRWSLDTGQVERLHSGRVLTNEVMPAAQAVDVLRQRRLELSTRADRESARGYHIELALRRFDSGPPIWLRQTVDASGQAFDIQKVSLSPDGRWLAAVVKASTKAEDQGQMQMKPSMPSAGGLGRALADRLRPDLAERLRGALGGARKDAPPQAQAASAPPAPPTPPADVWLAGRGERLSLVLVDAETGRAQAVLALDNSDAKAAPQFVGTQRLLLGQRMVDIDERNGGVRLAMPLGRAFDGRLVGITPQSLRPIVAGGRSAGSLRALRLPDAYQQAGVACTSADDRWLALAQDDRLVVLDVDNGMRSVLDLPLDGARVEALRFAPGGRLLAAGLSSGVIKLIDAPRARELLTLMAAADGQWTVVDPQGRLDSSNLGSNAALHWVTADKPLQPLPFDALMRAFHTPDLMARAVHGDAALDKLPSLAGKLRSTPQVAIDAVEPLPGTPARVRLRVSVQAAREADGTPGSAQDLRVLRNGRLVAYAPTGDGALPLDAASGRTTVVFDDVRLPEGGDPVYFQAYAFNRDGLRGDTASRTWQPPQPVKLGPGRAYVLAVGINRYDNDAFGTLSFAVNDARLMAQAVGDGLRRSGDWREVVAVTLESQPGGRNDATKARIEAALGVLAGRPGAAAGLAGVPGAEKLAAATPADLVLLAFAGHGYISPVSRELQLVPSDVAAAPGTDGLARFDRSTISTLDLDRWLRPLDAGHLAIVIDACHSAAAVAAGFSGGPVGSRGLGQLAADKGARLLAATQAADFAMEHQQLRHGLLSYVLLKEGLQAARADHRPADGRIDLLEWLRYAEQRLPELQQEMARGIQPPPVQGERAISRGFVRIDPATGKPLAAAAVADRLGLQRPRLFDFVPPGHAEPLVGRAGP